jgi:hypothetical protein
VCVTAPPAAAGVATGDRLHQRHGAQAEVPEAQALLDAVAAGRQTPPGSQCISTGASDCSSEARDHVELSMVVVAKPVGRSGDKEKLINLVLDAASEEGGRVRHPPCRLPQEI